MTDENSKKEVATTVRWGVGIILTIFIQTMTFVWYFAQIDSLVKQHTVQILELKNGTSVYISREQLDDLLGSRDEKTANIEKTLIRIEGKLDKILP